MVQTDRPGSSTFSCIVIGRGAIATRCLEKMSARGVDVLGVFSADGSLVPFTGRAGWRHFEDRKACVEALTTERFDHLFSIDNGWILPAEVIATPLRSAINFHDGPLPAYAGLHVTSWALLNGETTHGVTWHEIDDGVDTGAILEQRSVPIEPDDTSFTLNARCFDVALVAFDALLARLLDGAVERRPQATTERSYFGRRARPDAAGVLTFAASAAVLDQTVRALEFGPTRNPLGLAKVRVGERFVCPTRSVVQSGRLATRAGEVVGIDGSNVWIGTATTDIVLSGWKTLNGELVRADDVAALFGPAVGTCLAEVGASERASLSKLDREVCVHEPFFAEMLADLAPVAHPYAAVASGCTSRHMLGLPDAGERLIDAWEHRDWVVAVFAAYALRISDRAVADVGLDVGKLPASAAGLFAHVLPLRLTAAPEQGFESFAVDVSSAVTDLVSKRSFAMDLVAREPSLRALGPSHLPIVIRLAASPAALSGSLSATRADTSGDVRPQLAFVAFDDGSAPELVSDADLDPSQVAAIQDHLRTISAATIEEPRMLVRSLPLLTETQRQTILHEWNDTHEAFPDSSIHELIRRQAERMPDAFAVRFGARSLTYRELMAAVENVATRLRGCGVEPGDVVAVSLPRSAEVVIAMLGVLEAGAAYLPVDPSYPPGRVATMIEHGRASAVVTNRQLRDSLFAAGPALAILIDGTDPERTPRPTSERNSTTEDLAYVIFTSGSTGTPKGVEICHRGLVNHGLAIARNYGLGPGDRLLCSASIAFDVAGEQIYPALLVGAEVVVRPEDLFDSFSRFDTFIRDEAITAMVLPTAFWHEWVRHLERTGTALPPLLRSVSTGTEKVLASHLASWLAMSGDRVRFFQGYGPTEATITCTMYACPVESQGAAPFDAGHDVPIGRPLPNTTIHILDSELQPVPIGVDGEIHVGGVGLARGYRGDPVLTADRFIADPFVEGSRLYRTGDLGQYTPDGQIIYRGRRDSQIKIRGYRVELGEVESVLRSVPGVEEAVVIVDENAGQRRLLGYVVSAADVDPAVIDAHVRAHLPDSMVPAAVVQLRSLPTTTNQKVDRSALPRPIRTGAAGRAPRNATEKRLQQLWARALGRALDDVGTEDDFFELGADSLGAVAMLSEVEDLFERAVLLSAFVRTPTILALAAAINRHDDDGEPEQLIVVIQAGSPTRRPLWLIHPVGGHVVFGNQLRASMRPGQPLLGIQARGLDGRATPETSIATMADHYTALVRATQPVGPYRIAGPSMGGYIAIEIARRLERLGEHVEMLVLLDSWAPGFPRPTSQIARLRDNLAVLATLPTWRARGRQLRERWRNGPPGLSPFEPPHYAALEQLAERLGTGKVSTVVQTIERVTLANEEANRAHVVEPFQTPLVLLRADQRTHWSGMRFDDPNNGWLAFAIGGVRAIGFDCAHEQLADEPGPEVGTALQSALDSLDPDNS